MLTLSKSFLAKKNTLVISKNPLSKNSHHIKTGHLIWSANQLTVFYTLQKDTSLQYAQKSIGNFTCRK